MSAPFLSLVIDHGKRVQGASAAYVLALRGQDVSSWSNAAPLTILSNDPNLAAVEGVDAAGAVFWQPGSVALLGETARVESDTPAVVWLAREGSDLTVSVADPAQSEGVSTLTVSGSFVSAEALDPGVQVSISSTGVTLTVQRAGGLTHPARLRLPVEEGPDAGSGPAGDGDSQGGDGDEQGLVDAGRAAGDAGPEESLPDAGLVPSDGGQIVGSGCSLREGPGSRLWAALTMFGLCVLLRRRRAAALSTKP